MEAGRLSRSAEFVTSFELSCLLNLLYYMLSECCVKYINLYNFTEGFRVVFRFSHTSTFELISSVAMAQPGVMVTIGGEYGSFPEQLLEHTAFPTPRDEH